MEDGALRREAARLDVSSLLEGEAVAAVSDDDLSSVQALQQVLETRLDAMTMFGMESSSLRVPPYLPQPSIVLSTLNSEHG